MDAEELLDRLRGVLTQGGSTAAGSGPLDPALQIFGSKTSTEPAAASTVPAGFELRGEVGRGGMGVVLRVRDAALGRDLAMKVVRADAGTPDGDAAAARLLAEARITAELDHPGVVPVHQLGTDVAGRPWFTMKLVSGEPLDDVLAEAHAGTGSWNLTRGVQVLLRVCETVAFAHHRGIVHRDLKPQNILVGTYGEAYVMDWGIADRAPDGPSAPPPNPPPVARVAGTPAYMAPEQAEGTAPDPRADVYALGCLLHQLLRGSSPFAAFEDVGCRTMLEAVRQQSPPSLDEVAPGAPAALRAVAAKAMAREPGTRYPTARELADDLQRWLEGRVVLAHEQGPWAELRRWMIRNRGVAAALAIALLIAVSGGVALLLVQRDAAHELAAERDQTAAAAKRAEGLRLAAAAIPALRSDPCLSLHLARRGAALAPGHQTDQALLEVLEDYWPCQVLLGHESYVDGLHPAPSGKLLASREREQPLVIVWDVVVGSEVRRLDEHDGPVTDVCWSPDGARLATASTDGSVRIADLSRGGATGRLHVGRAVRSVAWSRDGLLLATASDDGSVQVWDPTALCPVREVVRHQGAALAVRFDPSGTFVASLGADGTVATVRTEGGQPQRDRVEGATQIDFTPAGSWLSVRSAASERLIAFGGGLLPEPLCGEARRIWFAADESVAYVTPTGKEGASVWRRATGTRTSFPFDNQYSPVAVDVERNLLACGRRYEVELHDLETGRLLTRLRGHRFNVTGLCVLAGGRIASASKDRSVRIWTTEREGHGARRISGRRSEQWRLAGVFDDGRLAAWIAAGAGGDAVIAEVRTGRPVARLLPPPVAARDPCWSARAGALALLTSEGLAIHDGRTGARRTLVDRERIGESRPVAFAHDGRTVLLQHGYDPPLLVDVPAGTVTRCEGLPVRAHGLALSFDGRHLAFAFGLNDQRAGVWERATQRWVEVRGHTGTVVGFAFAPDARRVASTAVDGSVQVTEVTTGRVLHRIGGLPVTTDPPFWSPDDRWISVGEHLIPVGLWRHALTVPRPSAASRFLGFTGNASTLLRLDGTHLRLLPMRPAEHARALDCPAPQWVDLERLEVGTADERLLEARDSMQNQPGALEYHRTGMLALGAGDLDAAVAALQRSLRVAPRRPLRQADLAVALALRASRWPADETARRTADLDAAFAAVRAALAPGGPTADDLAKRPELAALRGDARWPTSPARR